MDTYDDWLDVPFFDLTKFSQSASPPVAVDPSCVGPPQRPTQSGEAINDPIALTQNTLV